MEREPALLQSAWDWAAGISKVRYRPRRTPGSRDMALFLMDRGARFDLFAAAMLGQLAAFKAAVESLRRAAKYAAPTGIPLLSHAIQGDAAARGVLDYLSPGGMDVNARFKTTLHAPEDRGAHQPGRNRCLLLNEGAIQR